MLKIRLTRIGAKKRPFYRVVVIDERSKRDGQYLELLGTYNPLTEPKEIKLKQDRIDHWTKQGAQMSTGFLRIIGKAPQRKPRKAKKEKQESSTVSPQPSENKEETPAEQPTNEEMAKPEDQNTESAQSDIQQDQPAEAASTDKADVTENAESTDSSPAEPVQNDNKEKEEKKDEGSA